MRNLELWRRTNKLLKRELTSYPSVIAAELKNNHPELLHNNYINVFKEHLLILFLFQCKDFFDDTVY